MDDRELIQACREGRHDALAGLIDRWRRPLYGYLVRMTGQRADAEDLFQETWVRVWQTLPRYDERGSFPSYLFTVASRLCIDRSRRVKARLERFEPESDERPLEETAAGDGHWPDRLVEDQQARALLAATVEALPEPQRQTVLRG